MGRFCVLRADMKVQRWKGTFDRARLTIATCQAGFLHDLKHMVCVFWADDRAFPFEDALHHVVDTVGPRPVGVGFLVKLPGAYLILPQLIAVGVPIVALHLDRAATTIDFEGASAIALN